MNKKELRAEAKARIARMSDEERAAASEAISRRLWELPQLESARVILLYASIASEVSTTAIAGEAARRGMVLTYPRCLPETRAMVLHRVASLEELRNSGAFGIPEPDTVCPVVELSDIDVALVPGLGWDRWGNRLGRGAGYYDRLLLNPAWRGFRCGLFFAVQEFDRLVTNRLDAPLDAVVTEREIVRFDAARERRSPP
ncbi:MAG TPA: 5-formyltetrahydrofolate cyclo-ligase [Longimicrobiaceae bacterium]